MLATVQPTRCLELDNHCCFTADTMRWWFWPYSSKSL